jgi:energy-coupling factor transporter ATP-binding protein EcfA2
VTRPSQLKLTLKNYRCFPAEGAATIDLDREFVALVGPNNSGKSTVLRAIYELRPLFKLLKNEGVQGSLASGGLLSFPSGTVDDPLEMFNASNDRAISVEIRFDVGAETDISGVDLRATRAKPGTWSVHFVAGPAHDPVKGIFVHMSSTLLRAHTNSNSTLRLDGLFDALTYLCGGLYVGAFRNAISEGSANYFDLAIGTGFIELWDEWKTGSGRKANIAIQDLSSTIGRIFGYSHLEIGASSDKRSLHLVLDGRPCKLREVGGGLAQFLIVLANVVIKEPTVLLIDEPELSMHPVLQMEFLTTLGAHVSGGVLFATHSIGLARSTGDPVYSVRRGPSGSELRMLEETRAYTEFLGEMGFSAFRELGYRMVLLVEGRHDVKTMKQFLRAMRKEHEAVVLPLNGASMINATTAEELVEIRRLGAHVAAVIDSERLHEGAPLAAGRAEFLSACGKLGIDAIATERRALENYLPTMAIRKVLGAHMEALAPYAKFSAGSGWSKSRNWRIAYEMTAMDLQETDLGRFLSRALQHSERKVAPDESATG